MPDGITLLPDDVVHLIAAGEVIDSLAAVVRELGENSLDAGATRITIVLSMAQWRIQVADNGVGMALQDLTQAASAHSTSKIRDRDDLWRIKSLGFRGEALHSLAQLADLQIASRPAPQPHPDDSSHPFNPDRADEGWSATYDSLGRVKQLAPVAIAPGTVVTADNIFANLPGRRQGLPAPAQQLRAIQLVIHHLALCHPAVTWHVQQDDRVWFTLFPGHSARQIIPQILRGIEYTDLRETLWNLADLSGDEQSSELSVVQLNGSQETAKNVISIDASDDGADRHLGECSLSPQSSFSLLLGLPDRCHRHRPDWIKVAVNGRWVRQPELEQTILAGFRRTLPRDRYPVCLVHLSVPSQQIDWNRHPAKTEIYLHHLDRWQQAIAQAIERTLHLQPETIPDGYHTSRMGGLLKAAEAVAGYFDANPSPETSAHPIPSVPLKVLAQVHDTYILVEHATGVWLIEQHVAHERVLYEALRDRWQLVPLDDPIILQGVTLVQQEQLASLGITLEPFGEQTWMVRSLPNLLARDNGREVLLELSLGGDLQTAQATIACRSAIRNGTSLTDLEMQELVRLWQQTRNPRTCPHGRPICLSLEESSLARFFRRNWIIGKSRES